MRQTGYFYHDFLHFDATSETKRMYVAARPQHVYRESKRVIIEVPFHPYYLDTKIFKIDNTLPTMTIPLVVQSYGPRAMLRLTTKRTDAMVPENDPMFEIAEDVYEQTLNLRVLDDYFEILDDAKNVRMRIRRFDSYTRNWSNHPLTDQSLFFDASLFLDDTTEVAFMPFDMAGFGAYESVSLGFVKEGEQITQSLFSLRAAHNEKFAGTGERFSRMNLAGQSFLLKNTDAHGANSRRAYKNVPFFLSSRGYGVFLATTSHTSLALASHSTRAIQGVLNDAELDIFFLGGKTPNEIVQAYHSLTGVPRIPPLWSFGIWMSRMSYTNAEEVESVATRLRQGRFPADVLHIDTGWFEKDWQCDWKISEERFPNPSAFFRRLKENGFRVSLWQLPMIAEESPLLAEARENAYVAVRDADDDSALFDISTVRYLGQIDFSNPKAVTWYQSLLRNLLDLGVAAIKTDFGEDISLDADYHAITADKLHNMYGLLYQKAAFEVTEEVTGQGIIWARASWAGAQRYPVHWGGDPSCSFDGLAGTIRGGLHLGVSGFAFWSHDIPGFHGVPDFMASWPSNELYVRWTQVGVFTSHMRYHGAQPREPYEYPEVQDIVRSWWNLRYALIPYILNESTKTIETGKPLFRALLFEHPDDPFVWEIDDEYYFGDSFLVAPLLSETNIRDIYLPQGRWVDFFDGTQYEGPLHIRNKRTMLSRMPVFVRHGATIGVYPEIVMHTGEMDFSRTETISIDDRFAGIAESEFGKRLGFAEHL